MLKRPAVILILAAISTSVLAQPIPVWITDKSVQKNRVKSFARDMQDLGFAGDIASCNQMVRIAASYGAICKIKAKGKTRSAMICNDDMIGHFALKSTFAAGDLVRFIEQNCSGS